MLQNSSPPVALPTPLKGVVPPLVTPLTPGNKLDVAAFTQLIGRVTAGGVTGLFLLGTTGEFCSLTLETRKDVIRQGCLAGASVVPVIVNVSDTSLENSIELAQFAARSGAAAVALCPPYYYLVSQVDLIRYGTKFAGQVSLPVFLYNIPQNAHLAYEPATVSSLAAHPNIVGIKNSNGDLDYLTLINRIKRNRPGFSILVGNEEIMLPSLRAGADGAVCGGANMFPRLYVALYHQFVAGDHAEAQRLQSLIARLAGAVYTSGSPGTSYLRGLKAALAYLDICSGTLAEPLTIFSQQELSVLHRQLIDVLPDIS